MSQVVAPPLSAISYGSIGVLDFAGQGDPNSAVTDPNGDLSHASIGSTYRRVDAPDSGHAFYVKTAAPTQSAVTGTWTAK